MCKKSVKYREQIELINSIKSDIYTIKGMWCNQDIKERATYVCRAEANMKDLLKQLGRTEYIYLAEVIGTFNTNHFDFKEAVAHFLQKQGINNGRKIDKDAALDCVIDFLDHIKKEIIEKENDSRYKVNLWLLLITLFATVVGIIISICKF